MGEHVTVRIPELPDVAADLSLSDRFPVWQETTNSTRNATLAELRSLVLTGGSAGSYAPVTLGSTIIVSIGPDNAGVTSYGMPDIVGKDFKLRRRGTGILVPGIDYEILSAGGFKLLREGDVFYEGDVFELELFALQSGGGTGGGAVTAASLFVGRVQVASNLTMNSIHLNKLIQIRGVDNQIVLTLPKITDYPENTLICIEASINNSKISRITTQDGQFIYMNNDSFTSLYISKSEVVWILVGDDGFYIENNFGEIYNNVGNVRFGYRPKNNELMCNGQEIKRLDYPRLWEEVQKLGASLINDSDWILASKTVNGRVISKPNRGFFSRGDGSKTFRLPDLSGLGIQALAASDPNRSANVAGGYKPPIVGQHAHPYVDAYMLESSGSLSAATEKETAPAGHNGGLGNSGLDTGNDTFLLIKRTTSAMEGNDLENVMENWGGNFYIKY